MCCRMLLLRCVTIFFVTWNIGCDDFNKLFIEDKNEYSDSTAMAINFLIKYISSTDVRIVGTELFSNIIIPILL